MKQYHSVTYWFVLVGLGVLALFVLIAQPAAASVGADVQVSVEIIPAYNLNENDPVSITIFYENVGDAAASNVAIAALLPAEFINLNWSATGSGVSSTGVNQWQVNTVAPNDSEQITLIGTVTASLATDARQRVTVDVTAAAIADAHLANNAASAVAFVLKSAEMTITGDTSVDIGQSVDLSATLDAGSVGCCASSEINVVDAPSVVGEYSSIAIGADGLPIVSYHASINSSLVVVHCDDAACTTGTRTELDTDPLFNSNYGTDTSITVGRDGLAIVAYRVGGTGDLKIAHCQNVVCNTATISTIDSTDDVGKYTSIAIGADGLPIVSYFDVTNSALKFAHCDDAACTTAAIVTVDNAAFVGEYSSIAVGMDGLPIISYYDNTPDDLKIAHCADLLCSSATITVLDATDRVGLFTSIAIGADGLPIVAYYDKSNDELNVAHCQNAACTTANFSIVDSNGDMGQYAAIVIGADGLPVISYLDNDNDNLMLAHCADVACTTASTVTVDNDPVVGQFTDIAIGADGQPVISYYEGGTSSNFRIAHCTQEMASLVWSWGDGLSDSVTFDPASSAAGSHIFAEPGIYNVTAQLDNGTGATFTQEVTVSAEMSDLPPTYGTAWHTPSDLYLGSSINAEPLPETIDADLSDDGLDVNTLGWVAGSTSSINVTVSGRSGYLAVWIDWDADGLFSSDELVISQVVTTGTQSIPLPISSDYVDDDFVAIRARFYEQEPATLSPVGFGGAGEVEDFLIGNPTAVTVSAAQAQTGTSHMLIWLTLMLTLATIGLLFEEQREQFRPKPRISK